MDEQRLDDLSETQLYADTGCSLEDLPGTMDDRDGWREKVREISEFHYHSVPYFSPCAKLK